MNVAYLNTLLDYHYWARDRALAGVATLTPEQYTRDMGNSFPSMRDTLNHIYMGEWVWLSRWQGNSPKTFPDTPPSDFAALTAAWSVHETKMRAFLSNETDGTIGRDFDYTLFNGKAGRSKFWEMFVHVINHATYHRGQVTTLLRQLGAKPAESMDLIAYFRALNAPRP